MMILRCTKALALGAIIATLAACETAPPPPAPVPASFRPLGVSAPYLMGDVIGGTRARAAKMRAAKIGCEHELLFVVTKLFHRIIVMNS